MKETPTREIRVLVCGSRTWNDPEPIRLVLAGLKAEHPDSDVCVFYEMESSLGQLVLSAVNMLNLPNVWLERHDVIGEYEPHLVFAFLDDAVADARTRQYLDDAKDVGSITYVISHDTD